MPHINIDIKSKSVYLNGQSIQILKDIAFTINNGEFVSIIGPSGSGKTTLLNIILGLQRDFDGIVLINNKEITSPGLDRGMVFQDHRLMPWLSVEENIAFALPALDKFNSKVTAIIAKVGLCGFEKALPNQLSGGMAQRVALARALVNVPGTLLLDEPFGSLDDFTRFKMQTELQKISAEQQTTTVMVTHNIEEACILSSKVIVLGGTPSTVLDIIDIDMPYPRDRRSEEFIYFRNKLITEL